MNILDKKFKYVCAAKTDIRKTIRAEQKRLAEEKSRVDEDIKRVLAVRTIVRKP